VPTLPELIPVKWHLDGRYCTRRANLIGDFGLRRTLQREHLKIIMEVVVLRTVYGRTEDALAHRFGHKLRHRSNSTKPLSLWQPDRLHSSAPRNARSYQQNFKRSRFTEVTPERPNALGNVCSHSTLKFWYSLRNRILQFIIMTLVNGAADP